jgi:hypothetical protein
MSILGFTIHGQALQADRQAEAKNHDDITDKVPDNGGLKNRTNG